MVPTGTVAVIVSVVSVFELTWKIASTRVPPAPVNVTEIVFSKPTPVIVTVWPTAPDVGLTAVMQVPASKVAVLVAVPPGVETVIGPSVAPVGTSNDICVGATAVPVTGIAVEVYGANRTSPPEVVLFSRFVPLIVTSVPAGPHVGVNEVTVGAQPPGFAAVKAVGLVAVPLSFVTWIVPLAPPATVAQTSDPETILKADTGVPAMSTLDTGGSSKFVPVMTITQPAGPLVGENDVMVGSSADAGAATPSTSKATPTPTPATRTPRCRLDGGADRMGA